MAGQFGPPSQVISSSYEIAPDALEQIFQLAEQRGLRIPVGQVVGYQRERLVVWLEQAVAQAIPNNAQTPITFDTVRTDKQKVFDGTSTITVPYAGVYLAVSQGGFVAGAGTIRTFVITQNGVGRGIKDQSAGLGDRTPVVALIVAAKGDTIKAEQYQNSGGNLNTFGCSFGVTLLNAY